MPWKMIIGAAANTATGLVNNALSQGNAREQREWTEKMWSKENAYNSPAAMAARMRSAGLNPFTMTGAQPAGSVGNGATAETIPLQSPLDAFKTISEVENINASTNKIETENEKLLKEMSVLDVLYEKDLLSKEEYELRLEKLKESWEKYNPYTLDAEKTIAETGESKSKSALADAQAKTEDELRDVRKENITSDTALNEELAHTEDELRDVRKNFISAQTDTEKSKQYNFYVDAVSKKMHALVEKHRDDREALRAPLERIALRFANDLGATENELARIRVGISSIWFDESRPDWINAILDFITSNVRLGGSASYTSSSSKITK